MGDAERREEAIQLIASNIARFGHHIYIVASGPNPRFAYTTGLHDSPSAELVLAGALIYLKDDATTILNDIVSQLRGGLPYSSKFTSGTNGTFTLRAVHPTWAEKMMLGAFDYFGTKELEALQIVPDQEHWTIDVPDMRQPWSAVSEPAWAWLYEPWTLPVSSRSVVVTNIAALKGGRVTEVTRWELDQWEAFAGPPPDTEDDARVVPIGTLIGADGSLSRITTLDIGEGIRRESNSDWEAWEDS